MTTNAFLDVAGVVTGQAGSARRNGRELALTSRPGRTTSLLPDAGSAAVAGEGLP
jgi:hypothetical protein